MEVWGHVRSCGYQIGLTSGWCMVTCEQDTLYAQHGEHGHDAAHFSHPASVVYPPLPSASSYRGLHLV